MIHLVLLVGCAVGIYVACEWFVNAVEWLGVQLKVGPVAVGTILAAVGTALPESVVTLVAVTLGTGAHSKDIGVGAAMGGPLALATVAYGVTGALLLTRRRRRAPARTPAGNAGPSDVPPDGGSREPADLDRLARDQRWFLAIFVVKVGLGLVAFAFKPVLGVAFLAAYAVYFAREMRDTGERASGADLEPLKLQPKRATPTHAAVALQVLVTLAVIFGASQVFVAQLEWAGPALGLSPVVVALLLSPIATELPEVMNAIIWVRQGKLQLALANISGAMMIQATVPSALGIFFTPWSFDGPLISAGLVTMATISYLLILMHRRALTAGRLAVTGAFYLVFAASLPFLT